MSLLIVDSCWIVVFPEIRRSARRWPPDATRGFDGEIVCSFFPYPKASSNWAFVPGGSCAGIRNPHCGHSGPAQSIDDRHHPRWNCRLASAAPLACSAGQALTKASVRCVHANLLAPPDWPRRQTPFGLQKLPDRPILYAPVMRAHPQIGADAVENLWGSCLEPPRRIRRSPNDRWTAGSGRPPPRGNAVPACLGGSSHGSGRSRY